MRAKEELRWVPVSEDDHQIEFFTINTSFFENLGSMPYCSIICYNSIGRRNDMNDKSITYWITKLTLLDLHYRSTVFAIKRVTNWKKHKCEEGSLQQSKGQIKRNSSLLHAENNVIAQNRMRARPKQNPTITMKAWRQMEINEKLTTDE